MAEQRLDSAESRFFLRQLEAIESEMYKEEYPEIKYSKFIPTKTGFDPGAKKVIYRMLQQVGQAALVSNKALDIPRVDVKGAEYEGNVVPIAAAYGFDIYEIKGAAKANIALDNEGAMTAREAIEQKLDLVAALGDTATGLNGFCNHSSVTTGNAPNGAGGTPQWTTKTADEMLTDLTSMASYGPNNTSGIEWPDTILLPTDAFTMASNTRVGDTGKNVLEYFLNNSAWITNIDTWYHLDSAGGSSAGRGIAYKRNRRKVELKNPHGMEQLPPDQKGLVYEVILHMSTAAVTLRSANAMYYFDDIGT